MNLLNGLKVKNKIKQKTMSLKYIIAFVLIILVSTSQVYASYDDVETSNDSYLSATSLDISLVDEQEEEIVPEDLNITELVSTESKSSTVYIKKSGYLDFNYNIESTTPDEDFCNLLNVKLYEEDTEVYSGLLKDLSYTSTNQGDTTKIELEFEFESDVDDFWNNTCNTTINISSWQLDSDGTWGYTDNEDLPLQIISGEWVVTPIFDIVTPDGGETYKVGDTITIEWIAKSGNPTIDNENDLFIFLAIDLGPGHTALLPINETINPLATLEDSLNDGELDFQIPTDIPELINDKLKVTMLVGGPGIAVQVYSDDFFEITADEENSPVVINEIMWSGSTESSADEWIELRNRTPYPILLDGWEIENAAESGGSISLSGTIPAYGYFLITNYETDNSAIADSISPNLVDSSLSLKDDGEQLILKNIADKKVDSTPDSSWVAGEKDPLNRSMERNLVPGNGEDSSSWHSCESDECNDTTYWDNEGDNYGTPGSLNHSHNDPTHDEEVLEGESKDSYIISKEDFNKLIDAAKND